VTTSKKFYDGQPLSLPLMDIADTISEVVRRVFDTPEGFIPLHEPSFAGHEWAYLKECLDSTFVSSVGKFVDQFEDRLAQYTGAKSAVAVVNGTCALHLALKLAGVQREDEVLLPALTFVATANAVSYCNAIPHFVDADERTLGIDPVKLDDYLKDITVFRDGVCSNKYTRRKIRAMIPMHTFGHPVDLDALKEISDKYKLCMIEDAAEALGSRYKNRHVGTWGHLAVLSFNGNKIVTTGGGGAILTNNEEWGRIARHLTTTAKRPHPWEYFHDQIGYNYRMPNINAALGCAQLERIPDFIRKKRELATAYAEAFAQLRGVTFHSEPGFAQSNYWLNALLITGGLGARDTVLDRTNQTGIMTRPVWTLLHKLPMYHDCPRMELYAADKLASCMINIPSSVKA